MCENPRENYPSTTLNASWAVISRNWIFRGALMLLLAGKKQMKNKYTQGSEAISEAGGR